MKRIYIIIAILFVVILLIYGLSQFFKAKPATTPSTNGQTNSQLPDYVLGAQDEARLGQFVKNFIDLYNSYGYNDFKSALNVAGYGTAEVQQQNIDRIDALENSTPEGYEINTITDPATFSFKYPQAATLNAQISGQATETLNGIVTSKYSIVVKVDIQFIAGAFTVTNITISKQ